MGDRRQEDDDAEEDRRREVAEVQRDGRVVAQRRAERERGEDRCPVVRLSLLRRDAVDRESPLPSVPDGEDHDQHEQPEQGRPGVRNTDVEVHEVRHARADDGDCVGEEPVGEGRISPRPELPDQPDEEQSQLDGAALEVAVDPQIVGGGLAARRREDLHHPEEEDDLGNLGGRRQREETADERHLSGAGT